MNDEFSLKDPDNLKTKIKKLVSFEEEKSLTKISRRKTVQNRGSSPIPAKYAKVLSCSFVEGSGEADSSVRKKPKIVHLPELTT
jgi:hypothetical protein